MLDAKTFLRCKNAMDLLYHHAKYDGAQTLYAAGGENFDVFLFVSLSVTLFNGTLCANMIVHSVNCACTMA